MRNRRRVWIAFLLLTLSGSIPAPTQDVNAAKLFLQSVYKNYRKKGPGIDFTGPKASRYFSSSLIALLDADRKSVGPNQVGVLDGDPVCSCQDWDAVRELKIETTPASAGRLQASVSFALFGTDAAPEQSLRTLEIALIRQGGQWRIDDIVDRSDPGSTFDLRLELEKEIRSTKHRAGASYKRSAKEPDNEQSGKPANSGPSRKPCDE